MWIQIPCLSLSAGLCLCTGVTTHHCEPHYLHLCKGALLEEKHGMTEEYMVPGKQHTLNQTMWEVLQSCLCLGRAAQAWRMLQPVSPCLLYFILFCASVLPIQGPVHWLAHKKSRNSIKDLRNSISSLLTYRRNIGKRDSPCCPPGQTIALTQLKQQGGNTALSTAHSPPAGEGSMECWLNCKLSVPRDQHPQALR